MSNKEEEVKQPVKEVEKVPELKMPEWAKELIESQKRLEQDLAAKDVLLNEQSQKLRMFEELAGKNTVASWEQSKKDYKQKFVHFKVWSNGKTVVGWSKMDNSMFNRKAGDAISENQMTTLYFRDGSEEKVNYSLFTNTKDLVFAKVISFGGSSTTVEFEDGEQRVIGTQFLNA